MIVRKLFIILLISKNLFSCSLPEKKLVWFNAIKNKDMEVIYNLINLGVDVNSSDPNEGTALLIAIENKDMELIEILLKNGANPNKFCLLGKTELSPLFIAVRKNNIDIIKLLFKYKLDVKNGNFPNCKCCHPIFVAIKKGNLGIINFLLRKGADPDSQITDGARIKYNLLIEAIRMRSMKIVELLLKHGANIDSIVHLDDEELTPLMLAMKLDEKIFEFLLKKGASYKEIFKRSSKCSVKEIRQNIKHPKFINLIKSQEVIDTYKDKLFEAFDNNDTESVTKNLNYMVKFMHSANYLDKLFLLLKDKDNNTVLHRAIMQNNYSLTKYILNFNHELSCHLSSLPNDDGLTPIDLAIQQKDYVIFNLFMGIAYA